jgi:hypothetical protein
MFRHRHQLRRWAAQVLLLWLFGIGAGFANACMASGVQASDEFSSGVHAGHAMHAAHHPGAAHDAAPAKANCQDFCAKTAISIPPLKSALDHAHADALPPPAVAWLFSRALAQPHVSWLPRQDGGLAPPIPIAFLRLAL